MKLAVRFTLAAFILVATSLLLGLAVSRRLERRHLERKQLAGQDSSLRRLARVAQDSSLQQNEVFLLNYLKVLKDAPEIRYAALVDENGLVRVHTAMLTASPSTESSLVINRPWDGPRHEGRERQTVALSRDGRELQDWSLPLWKGALEAGSVHIGFDALLLRSYVNADLDESRRPLLVAGAALLLLSWLAAAWLARSLTAPLKILRAGAAKLGSGQLDYRIALPRADELGDLAGGFNKMAGELERLTRLKEQLMASITHDLRSPLLAISGHAEILLTDAAATTAERRESAELIAENARRMSAMANDLTDLVKLQMGRLEVTRKPVHIPEALNSARRMLDVVAKRLDVRLEVAASPGLPTVLADASHLHRILTNLVSNALKFTPSQGRVMLRAVASAHHLKITVTDTGTGIPASKLKSLFTRFTGSEGVKHGEPDLGTGLGLSICRALVEQQGGKIWAESEWKCGTLVAFTLPRGASACSADC